MRLVCEVEDGEAIGPPGGGGALAAFLSFAVSRGFGAVHPLIALADHLHEAHGIPFGPLTTFYDIAEEDAEDREKREMTWQPAGTLAGAMRALAYAVASDEACRVFLRRGGAESLPAEAAALAARLESLPPQTRVRLGYAL